MNSPTLFDAINAARHAAGRQPLPPHVALQTAAATHADTMAATNTLTHAGLAERLDAAGWAAYYSAENVAAGYPTPTATVEGWLKSLGHRANLLDDRWTHLGAGWTSNTTEINYACAIFGTAKPQDEPPPPPARPTWRDWLARMFRAWRGR